MASNSPKKASQTSDPSSLDHTNIAIKYGTKKSTHKLRPPPRIILKEQPMRPYPGEIREIKRGVDGAVYADDLEKEEALKQSFGKGMSQEVSKDDLMLSADFLKLDQSKLPLEMFDNLEYESLDRSPEEWMMASRRGTIPFYDSGSWTWRSVQVLGYNADTNEYHVQFSPDGAKKFVGRLNLRFDEEEESAFTARRNFAKSAREEAKKVLRLDHFIGQQPKEAIRAIRQTSLHKIHERIIEGLPASIPFPEQGSPLGSLLSNLTKQLILFYSRAMKTTVVFAQLSEVPRYRREATVERYKQLDLPAVPAKPPVPRSGKVACPEPEVPYSLSRARIAASHCSSKKEILNVFKWLHDRWNRRFQNYAFMDVQLEGVTLPCSLDAFKRAQGERLENTAKQLKTELRTAFLDHFLDCVQDVFDLFQSNMAAYKAGALFRLHRVLDLTLQTFLRQILLSSLDEWKRLVERNTRCTVDDPKAPSLSLRATEVTFSLSTRTPMFLVELRVMNGKVVLEPSAEDIQSSFVAKIDSMVAVLRGVLSVDKDTMNLLTLENRVLLNIGEGDPMFADLDAVVSQAKSFVSSHIAAAMKRPLALAKLYEEYMWLMEYDEYIDGFSMQVPPPSQEDFKRELLKLDGAVKTIQNISFGQEDFDLVRVDTAGAKEMLSRHAREMRDGLLTMVVNGAKQEHIDIVEKYNAMLNRIAEKPANEKQLADLRDYIISSKEAVTELQSRVAESRRNLSILDSFSVPLPEEDMILSWEILKFPARIESSGREVEMSLETDKDRMMAKLTADREHFSKLVDKLGEDVQQAKLQADYGDKEKIVERFNQLMDSIQGAKAKGEDFNMRERVFGFVTTDYGVLDHYVEELHPFNTLWIIVSDFHNERNDWLNGDFSELDGKEIEEKMTEWWKTSFKLAKSLEEEYEEVSACAMKLREETSEFRSHLPVIQSLASKALKDTHWDKISELLGKSIDPQDDLHLQDLLDLDAAAHIEEIQEITIAAEKEYNLERQLDGMTHDWDAVEFEVKPYRSTGTFVVSGIDDIMTLLDDHIVKTQTMRGNPFIKPIEEKCKDWEIKLKYAQGLLEEWTKCQRTWMYLEPIFGSDDIVRQLPAESKKFKGVDSLWRKTLEGTNTDANFMRNADPEKRLEEKFKKANEKLDEIQKGLNEYLETKRLYFPRFFFLSDDELLEILSQTKEPRAVQPHLGKCFEGINKVKFESDLKISQMISSEDEVVKMDRPIDPETTANKGNVERWLLELESIQWDSIRTLTVGSIEQYKSIKRNDWILNWPAQVILGVSSLYWTVEVTQALAANGGDALKGCRDNLNHQLKDIVNLVRGKLDKLQRKTLGALTTIDVHNRDVVEKMVDLGTHEVTDFEWVSQLRYYWEDSWKDGQGVKRGQKTLVARIVNAKCLYGYEYLGNSSRLVMTALTDRCYRTMIGAVDLLYGGAPEGPAGTGKTETVKDLSKAVAIHCVVFNCSDGLDYQAMAKFFKGLAGCGSWCCFDEFNRINIEVLSVIAQQILVINQAKRENREVFDFEGTRMKINSNCNVFITMNPGYAGRAELPDNLKALFRPCAMMVPDYAMIGEIRLYSFGFEKARENAQKIVRVLQLSSEQLSSQKHYDYGMRAVNSILIAAGNLRQQLGDDPEWDEAKIVLRSINDVNLAKFLVEDLPLFRGITSDLFPGVALPVADYGVLPACIAATGDAGIEVSPGNTIRVEHKPEYVVKTIQLYEMVLVRHGVMVVGQTCSGKTATIHNLAKAMTKASAESSMFAKVQIYTINPKSVTSGQLYGMFDENTREFVDGILAVTFRKCARDTSPDRKWMMFDGPVDAVWIENMNTVLDDNKKLCLNSGEIIKMSDTMTMFFEAEDLEQASPATVSRVGMIFCETRNVGWEAVRNIWLEGLSDINRPHELFLASLFDWLFPVMSYFTSKFCLMPTPLAQQELIFMLLKLLKCLLDFDDGVASDVPKAIEGCFFFAMIWSVGACLTGDGRKNFDRFLRLMLSGDAYKTPEFEDFFIKNPEYHVDTSRKAVQAIPDGNSVYDYIFDPKSGKWVNWLENQPVFRISKDAKFNAIVVPTIDSVRNEWLMEKLLRKGFHVLCTGDTGTGKSVTIKNKLLSGMPSKFSSIFLNFSAQTSANQTQDLIDSKLDKRRMGVLGPPLGNMCIIMVDDLNMPAKEEFGAQPPIEILRQWFDHQGWYDRKENTFRRLVDIQFCAAMGPPGGGRTRITQRYVRHFNVINFVNFSNDSLAKVFSTILDWRLSQGFSSAVKQMSAAVVQATISVYNTIAINLLPTPSKTHYTFNLRDLSKVFQGVLTGDAENVSGKDEFTRLWAHECMRVFHDRLVDDQDRTWFNELVSKTVKDFFSADFAKVRGQHANILFANFVNKKRDYCEITDRAELQKSMLSYLDDYNQMTNKPMNLVLFSAALEHITRISRIINQPYGNALLVGVGGSGRKSLTTLAVSIAEFKLFTIEITKSYGLLEWREDIKKMMRDAGVQNKPTVFMMDDTQIVKEIFLEDINGILNTGEVANLFNSDEMSALMEDMFKVCSETPGVNAAVPAEVFSFFVSRVRTNLHLVLCLSPIGEAFRTRLRMFPSLVNCCTIDWFTEWPEEALRSVAHFFLASVELDSKVKEGVVDVCVNMQVTATALSKRFLVEMSRNYYVTPTSYLELINTFKSLLNFQRSEVFDAKARYDNGLSKLQATAEQVNQMEVALKKLQPELQKATVETEALLQKTSADKAVANEQSLIVEAETEKCNIQASEAKALKDSCEADLEAAIPALQAAEAALNSLDKKDITEMKAMKKPSAAIKMTMAAISILFGVKPDKKVKDGDPRFDPYWGPAAKELLNDPKLIDRLKDFDKDNMDLAVVAKVKIFTDDEEFEPSRVEKKGSMAAAGLARWVHAMVLYDGVARQVGPKRAKLKEAEQTLKSAQEFLAVKQAALKEVLDKVAELEAQLKEASDNKEKLNHDVFDCEAKLRRADALIKGLGGEKTRWTKMSETLALTYENVTGDILLSAGVIAYLGAFVASYRESAVHQWSSLLQKKGITCAETFSLRETLGNPVQIRSWTINKLPNDSFSIENGIMLFRSNRWPLMIDPQGQANAWIKEQEKGNLKVVKQNQGNFVRTLENSLNFGTPVLIENVSETLDPILEPILLKQIVVVGGIATIRLGDNTIDYDSNFRLYITTKLSNPHYPPELCVKVNLLNFMATQEGLQDQMLGKVVELEQEELERKRALLIQEDAENQRQLKEIEDEILRLLKNAQGNILDDEVLINTLAESKKTSNIIQEKVKVAEHTQQSIAKTRQGYVPVAFQAARLFFCIADLGSVDPMYQYSLEWYIALFVSAIKQAPKSKNLEERLHHLNECFTYLLYVNVCRSLFEKDKLLFSFLLTTKILLGRKVIVDPKAPVDSKVNSGTTLNEPELRFFLQGSTSMEVAESNPYPDWLSERAWSDLLSACELPEFRTFKLAFMNNERWKEVIDSTNPSATIDGIVGENFGAFKKLCLLRCLRPDMVVPGVQDFIRIQMGTKFIEPPQFDMQLCFNDSRCTTPLIFVLTPGADPMTELLKLAEDKGFGKKLQAISLGQGQGPIAERAVQEACDRGLWVCLQNCHLCVSWMPTLEKICEEFSKDTCHEDFRLWLTSEPSPAFPPFVLQNGVKMTNEPPKGMRANLLGSLYSIEEDLFECRGDSYLIESPKRVQQFKRILFGLCFFHADVRERRKFGPLGWNIQYVFSPKDLEISMKQLHKFISDLRSDEAIPFAALAYLVGECNYGGRVTDDKDRRCIMNILDDFYTPGVLEQGYKFSPSPTYFSPPPGSLEDYREYVRGLPFYEGPDVFGLHENANISCALSETNALLDTALSLQPRSSSGDGKSWGEILDEIAVDILAKLPEPFDIEKALILFPVRYEESMNTVLTQELIRFNRLLNEMSSSLKDIQKALKGLVLLSSELERMGNSMVIGKVPANWAVVAYPSLKPLGSWVSDLLERINFLKDWMDNGSPNVYWISGFFFTQAFITGTLQNFARKYTIPIDQAEFDFKVLTPAQMVVAKSIKPEDGAYLRGLFLEGARWNKESHSIAESHPRELFVQMPFIHLVPKPKDEIPAVEGVPEQYTGSKLGTDHVYMCPVYKTSFRQGTLSTTGHSTNFVMFMRLPMALEHKQKHWIKRGVALLTQLDT